MTSTMIAVGALILSVAVACYRIGLYAGRALEKAERVPKEVLDEIEQLIRG